MHIRPVTPADAVGVAPLLGQLGYPTEAAELAVRLERADSGTADPAWVALDEDSAEVVGFAAAHTYAPYELAGPVSELTAIVVDERARRTGVGEALVATFEAWSRARGCVRMSLSTALHRTGAHRFYEELGYEQLARRYEKSIR